MPSGTRPGMPARDRANTAASRSKPAPAREGAGARTRVTLRQLEAFCTVALTGSVSAGAQRLSRTQSAISLALQELESALGARLFERAGRGLRQTDAARRLLPKAIELVERATELPAIAGDLAASARHLAIGASRTIGPFLMPELLAEFTRRDPNLSIELVIENTGTLVARIRDLTLDLAFIEGEVLEPGLSVQPWMNDEICLFARAGHPAPRALANGRWVLRERGSGTRETFLRAMQPLIGTPGIAMEVSDPLALKRLVAATDWFGCLSRMAVAGELRDGTLRDVTPRTAGLRRALTRSFWLVSHPQRYRSAAADALLAHARAA
ncbi:MAG: LysR family transcriptional regulator, partial [Burkholderiales bacterium]